MLPGALRKLPAACPDRVAVLLDQVEAVTVDRNDDDEVRLLDDPVDAARAVATLDRVLPHPHPAILVDDTGLQLPDRHGGQSRGARGVDGAHGGRRPETAAA
jgi:hypothetical protein